MSQRVSTRRFVALVAATFVSLALVAGCSSSDSAGESSVTSTSTAPNESESPPQESDSEDDAAPADLASFPVTVETSFGPITLESKPERIVALSGAHVDMLVALGEEPVVFTGNRRAGDDLLAGYPWLEGIGLDLDNNDQRLLDSTTPALEVIASYEPDLILGTAGPRAIDDGMYAQISAIAPTYTSPHALGDWEAMATDLGVLTGRSQQAATVIEEVNAEFDGARGRLAGLDGATFVVADLIEQEVSLYSTHLLFQLLGLQPDTELAALGSVSLENIDMLQSDVLNIMTFRGDSFDRGATRSDLEADPRFGELPAVQNGAVVWSDAAMVNAVADIGPHSFVWWLQRVVPQLEESALNTAGR